MSAFVVGDAVKIIQTRPGGHDDVHGRGVVAAVTPRKITLTDATAWRADGYAWGSKPERGIGRSHARRIELVGA